MTQYITKDGDMLDLICMQHYGYSTKAVEIVITANPAINASEPLVSGIIIHLPEITKPNMSTVKLWD